MSHDESISSLFVLDASQSEPRSAEMYMLELNTPLSVTEAYRDYFYEFVSYCFQANETSSAFFLSFM